MKKNDKIVFKFNGETLEYRVTGGSITGVFLSLCEDYPNDKIFEILGIDDIYGFCERVICKNLQNKSAIFPELDSLEDLKKVVDALYQEIINKSVSKYNEGDIVRVLPKQGVVSDYPFGYTDDMYKYANDLFSIKEVHKLTVGQLKYYINCKKYKEPFFYILNNESLEYNWSSEMFSKVTEIDTRITVDTGEINIKEISNYIDTYTPAVAIACDKAVDGRFLYPEKSEKPEYKLNFSVKPLKF